MQTFAEYLAALGLDDSLLSDARRSALQAAWRLETGQAAQNPPPIAGANAGGGGADSPFADLMTRRQADLARERAIADACSACMDAHPGQIDAIGQVGQQALAAGWDRQRTELELLRRFDRANVGTLVNRQSQQPRVDGQVLEAAFLMGTNFQGLEKAYSEQTLQRAHDQFGQRGLSLGELLSFVARQRGWRGHSYSGDLEGVLRHAFMPNEMMASGGAPSSYSTPNIFSNVANKQARFYFEQVDQSWRKVSAIGTAKNFQQTTDVALTGSLLLQDLPKNGEIKHGTLGEAVYTNQVKTKALQLGIPREDLINDDSGALDSRNRRMNRGAALKFNKDFWTTLLSASSQFFDASLGNAGSTALSAAGLDTANNLFRTLTDPDGEFMGSTAAILLCGTGLEATAKALMSSTALNHTGDTNAYFPSDNPWAGMFDVVANPYVGSTAYGGAATRWYLLANPLDIPVIETRFLNGNQSPFIESTAMNWDQLGISMRIIFDYGIALQERRGGVKEN